MFRAILILLVVLGVAAPAWSAEEIGVYAAATGDVLLWRGGKSYRANPGNKLQRDDELETRDGKARVLFNDESVLTIGPRSRIKLSQFAVNGEKRTFGLDVIRGRFKIAVAKFFLGPTEGEIRTPTAVAGVRGTVVWGDTDVDAVCALEGQVNLRAMTGDPKGADLTAGQCVAEMKAGKTTPIAPTPDDLRKYLAEVTIP